MKVVTARIQGKEFVGIIKENKIINICFQYPNSLIECIKQEVDFEKILHHKIPRGYIYNLDEVELLAPIPKPSRNILCVGKNYREHALEMGAQEAPTELIIFTKATTTVTSSNSIIPISTELTTELDYEGELAIVIGKSGKNISEDEAMDYVFGYTIVNDITARDIQAKHQQFFLGKSIDHSCPMGPFIETELKDPQNVYIETRVNGEVRQRSNVSEMIFSIPTIISTISTYMTLEAGDIISTGTPAGVGKGMKPSSYLRSNDIVEVEINELGLLRNIIQ